MSDKHSLRRQNLLNVIEPLGVEAMLVTGEMNVRYLTGFTGDSTSLLLGPHVCRIISDTRYRTQLDEECPGMETFIRTAATLIHQAIAQVVGDVGTRKLGIEGQVVTIELQRQLRELLPAVEFVEVDSKVEELRAVKDASELAEIREAIRLAGVGFEYLKSILTPEMTEREAYHEMEHYLRKKGADKCAFPPILAVGDRGALPHYRPGNRQMKAAPTLLVDWGALTASHYHSDLTRVLITGTPSAEFRKVHEIVWTAQKLAIEAIRPGAKASDVDAVARNFIAEAGYGDYFGHGLGHGIGLNIHELPRFSPSSTAVLEPGMVITVEPGIYLPGQFGVRIEDDILVTSTGVEVLTAGIPVENPPLFA